MNYWREVARCLRCGERLPPTVAGLCADCALGAPPWREAPIAEWDKLDPRWVEVAERAWRRWRRG